MLSISPIASIEYYSDQVQGDEYVSEKGETPGNWGGVANHLGLSDKIDSEEYSLLFKGFHPKSGEKLVQNAGAENHRSGWDFTFSAPKSVSLAFAVADSDQQKQIETAQKKAVKAALKYIEQYAEVRTGKGGKERENAKLIFGYWQHVTSRLLDPQLHTHATIPNLGLCEDGKFRTLEPKKMYRAKMAAGAVYRAELAAELQKINLKIERDQDCFTLSGSNTNLEKLYSKRRAEIEQKLKEKGFTGAKASEIAALDTRSKKELIPRSELFERWQIEAENHKFSFDDLQNSEQQKIEYKTDAEILSDLTHRSSTFKKTDLERLVAVNSVGLLNAGEIQQKSNDLINSSEIVQLRNPETQEVVFTTTEMLKLEKQMVETSEKLNTTNYHPTKHAAVDAAIDSRTLSEEQEHALRHMTKNNQISCLVGIAGAGKSYTLGAANEAWSNSGYKVFGAALSGKAAEGLQDSANIKSSTIHSTLKELGEGKLKLDKKTVLVIDEAGMVGSRQTSELINHVEKSGAKLVLVGDHRQLQPIDAGGAFKAIESKVGSATMQQNRRQKEQWAAKAANDFRDGNSLKALCEYSERGLLHINDNIDRASINCVATWSKSINSTVDIKNNLMLAAKKTEVRQLNNLAREHMNKNGLLGASVNFPTAAGSLEIKEGDRLLFERNNKYLNVKNGTLGVVERITSNQILIKTDNGHSVNLYGSDYEHIKYGYAVTTHKCQGVTVDQTYVLNTGSMSSSELTYVQMSRHKNEAHLFTINKLVEQEIAMHTKAPLQNQNEDGFKEVLQGLAKEMDRSSQKGTTMDYELSEVSQEPPEVELELELEY